MAKIAKEKKQAAGAPCDGDEVRVTCGSSVHEGLLLPREGSMDFITLKLSSGYNIGIRKDGIDGIEVISKAKATAETKEKPVPAPQKPGKNFISLLGCGGTIASKIDYRSGAVDPVTTAGELLASIPSLSGESIRAKSIFSLLSEDITPTHWQKLAAAVADEIKDGAAGVVITHGTDTMSYTSAALSFMLQGLPCPIILVGSQRSSDRGSSDSSMNLSCSVFAARANLSGVFICMHENMSDENCLLHFGTKVRKMHTSRRDAFHSISTLPAARVVFQQKKVEKISERTLSRNPSASLQLDTKLNTNVALIYIHPGISPKFISSLSNYDGIVLAGTGLGHIPTNLSGEKHAIPIFKEVSALISSGIPVVMAPQAIYGRINMNVYSVGRAELSAGMMGQLCDFTPETAYVKLMWVLGREKKMEKVRALMETDLAGEISPCSEISDY